MKSKRIVFTVQRGRNKICLCCTRARVYCVLGACVVCARARVRGETKGHVCVWNDKVKIRPFILGLFCPVTIVILIE